MALPDASIRYFLGVNSPTGFISTAHILYAPKNNWHTYVLKGGPGTGKSSLLRSLYKQFDDADAEVFCCSADPSSLDALRLPKQKCLFIDGTAPHVIEPTCWGATEEIIPLFLSSDNHKLRKNASEIYSLTEENTALHARSREALLSAQSLLADNRRTETTVMNLEKIRKTAKQLAKTEWDAVEETGTEETRFISAVTAEGVLFLSGTVGALCPRIYAINDEYGATATALLEELRKIALADGQRCIVCPCPLFPNKGAEHLLLPDIGVAFLTSNRFHPVDFPVFRRIHVSRFLDAETLRETKNRLRFQARAAEELIQEAVQYSAAAKEVHDRLETLYAAATDWNIVDEITQQLKLQFI
ncbi:MAG: hypothetical protein J6Q42_04100 [Clostridia bacterium]|nr:hypothetical protein [Clostridia bacterium]